jgi:hypothetical protein
VLLDEGQHRRQRILEERLVHPEIDLLALLARLETPAVLRSFRWCETGGARQRRDGRRSARRSAAPRLEGEQDALAMLVASAVKTRAVALHSRGIARM